MLLRLGFRVVDGDGDGMAIAMGWRYRLDGDSDGMAIAMGWR